MSRMSDLHASVLDSATAEIVIGTRVYCMLYGGSYGIVYGIRGDLRPETVRLLGGGAVVAGGNAHLDIVFDNHESRGVPEAIVRGVQWKIFGEVATAEEIADLRMDAAAYQSREKLKAVAAADQFAAAVADLRSRADLSYLNQGDRNSGGVEVAKNIRKMLKKHFPKIKFRVTSDYNAVRIFWTDGPTTASVDELVDQFEHGSFDGMTDCYNMARSPWTEVFGGCRYVFTQRSETFAAVRAAFYAEYPNGLNDILDLPEDWWNCRESDFIRRAISQTAFAPAPGGIDY